MKTLKITLTSVLLLSLAGITYGKTVSAEKIGYTVRVAPYKAVKAGNGINVIFTECGKDTISVRAENVSRERILIYVSEGVLELGVYDYNAARKEDRNIHIDVWVSDDIESLEGNTGAVLSAGLIERSDSVKVSLTTGAIFRGDITADKVSMGISTGALCVSEIRATEIVLRQSTGAISWLDGSAEKGVLEISTGGVSNLGGFVIGELRATASTGSFAVVNAKKLHHIDTTGGLIRNLYYMKGEQLSSDGTVGYTE